MGDHRKSDYNLKSVKETALMCHYYKFIMKVHYQHSQYQIKLADSANNRPNTSHK